MTPANFILMRVFWESANWMHRRQFFCFVLCLPNEGTTAGKPWIVADAPALQRIAALVAAEREPKSAKQIVNPSLTGVRIAEAPAGAPLSQRYHVRLRPAGSESWRNVPVYSFFPQHEYNWAPTTESHFVTFESTGGIEVEVAVTTESKTPVIRPLNRKIAVRQEGSTLRFTMGDTARQLCLDLNGDARHPLVLFSNPPEIDVPKADDPQLTYFGPGYHQAGPIRSSGKGKTIYLAPGAAVEGSLAIHSWPARDRSRTGKNHRYQHRMQISMKPVTGESTSIFHLCSDMSDW